MTLLTNARERIRFVRFAVVGTIGAVVDYLVFNFFLFVVDTPLLLSGVISFLAAVTSNFIWNRYWTYPDSRSKQIHRQILQYGLVNALGLVIRSLILANLEAPLRLGLGSLSLPGPLTVEFLVPNLALAVALIVVLFWNYFVNRYWTYNDIDID
jgi:putative flippase GtrA